MPQRKGLIVPNQFGFSSSISDQYKNQAPLSR